MCPMVGHSWVERNGRKVLQLSCGRFGYEDLQSLNCCLEVKGNLLYCSKRRYDSFLGRFSDFDILTAEQAKGRLIEEWSTTRTGNSHLDTTI